MFDNIKEFFRTIFKSRLLVAATVMVLLFSVLIFRMFQLQIIKGEEYQDNYTLKIVRERTLNSTRGNILDRNGEVLAYNELAYSITIEDNGSYDSTKEKNKLLNAEIADIITALEKNGDDIINNFKITVNDNGNYEFTVSGSSLKRFLADVFGQASYSDLKYDKKLGYNQAEATADQVMDYLKVTRFGISEDYAEDMAYKITVVRYAMSENSYQKYIATTIASDVSEESVAYVSENASKLQGVEVVDDTIRKYNDAEYFASIIGYTGKISTEEYESLSADNDNYTLNDVVGKAGIEQVMDASLQGTKGYEKLYVDYLGKAVEVLEREEPSAGNDVYLSIDKNLQIAAYDLLEQEIAGIVYSNIESSGSEMNIPITDVYFALVNNNVIDIEHFSDEKATENEKAVMHIFSGRQQTVLSSVTSELKGASPAAFGSLGEEDQDYFTYIINQLKVGIFHLLHGRINDLNMFSELGGIFCNLLYIFTGQSYFFQSYLNQFKCLLNGSSHFSRYFIETGQSVLNLRRRSLCLGAQCTNLFGNNRKAFSGITGTGSFDRSIECKKVCLVGDVVDFSGFFKNHGKLGFEIMKNMFNFRRKFGHRSGCFHKTVEIL